MSADREWETDNPATSIGQRLNEIRRRLSFAKIEVGRLGKSEVDLDKLLPALLNEAAEIESDFENTRAVMYKLPELAQIGALQLKDESTSNDEFRKWLDRMFEVVLAHLLAIEIEKRVLVFSETVPLALHMLLRQRNDKHLSRYLHVIEILVGEMLGRFHLDENVFIVAGTRFSMIHLRGVAEDCSIVILPLSQYSHILGWIPLGHELGHVLFRAKSIDRESLYKKFLSIMMEHSSILDPVSVAYSWIWFEEAFADAVMTELFNYGAIMHLDSILVLQRSKDIMDRAMDSYFLGAAGVIEAESSYQSHPPPLLRLKLMLDFLEIRADKANAVEAFRNHLGLDAIDFKEDMSVLAPWHDKTFQLSITRLISEIVEKTGSSIDLKRFGEIVLAIKNESDLSSYCVLEIVAALTHHYMQQHFPELGDIGERPGKVLDYLISRLDADEIDKDLPKNSTAP